jgi:hypothetical protein
MKVIPLTQGKVAIVDDADFDILTQWKWCAHKRGNNSWVACRNVSDGCNKRKTILMHRLILNTPKGMETDHKNGNELDNRRDNLRICTTAQNQQNRHLLQDGKSSLFKGVSYRKLSKNWGAWIRVNGHLLNLGHFIDEVKAALAYDGAAKKYFGEFAHPNFIEV